MTENAWIFLFAQLVTMAGMLFTYLKSRDALAQGVKNNVQNEETKESVRQVHVMVNGERSFREAEVKALTAVLVSHGIKIPLIDGRVVTLLSEAQNLIERPMQSDKKEELDDPTTRKPPDGPTGPTDVAAGHSPGHALPPVPVHPKDDPR